MAHDGRGPTIKKLMAEGTEPVQTSENGIVSRWGILHLVAAALILVVLIFLARDSGAEITSFESWIAGQGLEGELIFMLASVILMSLFVPSSLVGALAGALFGLAWGTLAMAASGLLTAALTHQIASRLLRNRIERLIKGYPKLLAMQHAVLREGFRLQLMLRLAPISPVSVNYVLGAAGVRFPSFMLASLGMLPGLFVEVYFGHLAKHVSKVAGNADSHSTAETVVKVVGFLAAVGVMVAIGRMARRAITEAEESDDKGRPAPL